MTNEQRLAIYLRGVKRIWDDNGRLRLTPAQRRRLRKKTNQRGQSRLQTNSSEPS